MKHVSDTLQQSVDELRFFLMNDVKWPKNVVREKKLPFVNALLIFVLWVFHNRDGQGKTTRSHLR